MCKEFHWTPEQYDKQDLKTLKTWRKFMNIEAEEYAKKTDKQGKKNQSKFR